MTNYRPTYAEVDLAAVRANVAAMCARLRPSVEKLAVVKANAYGHGDVPVARACLEAGATRFAVALVEEGIRLRDAGIGEPILVLVETTPDAAKAIVEYGITPSVFTARGAGVLSDAASAADTSLPVHVCVDTGMHREGAPLPGAVDFVLDVARRPGLEVEGLWSHFAVADEEDHDFTRTQLERFGDLCEAVERAGLEVPLRHLGNSVTAIRGDDAQFDLVRMGLAIYGLYPQPWLSAYIDLQPAMRMASAVGSMRRIGPGEGVSYGHEFVSASQTTIASVLIGYADGYPRRLGGRADVLLGGHRYRLAGRVTMDQVMVDCKDADVSVGDEVVCLGAQGAERITAEELAGIAGTINYEIVCGISSRVPRVYTGT